MDKYIEKLWEENHFFDIKLRKDWMSKEQFIKAITQAMQAQREACYEEFFLYNEENKALQKVGNLNEMRDRILNAKVTNNPELEGL